MGTIGDYYNDRVAPWEDIAADTGVGDTVNIC